MNNLWGDFSEIETLSTPQKILNEQASYLNSATKNQVLATLVKSDPVPVFMEERNSDFKFDFILTSPRIRGYKYKVFKLFHDVQIYPLYIKVEESIVEEIGESLIEITRNDSNDNDFCEYEILDEETFLNVLRMILSSKTIMRVITSLISLADSM
ncbi:hypothetical protein [Tissierella praeacuta]|uniref:hypothetical protein n=1 Tax=Tissierella praeacuta TaxID=43131 RepID=UPI001C11A341|nr:hypothetical protein [Tissierella praeacuta]MBU5256839.1 hypothetical protein [Tissierella praeacuta]